MPTPTFTSAHRLRSTATFRTSTASAPGERARLLTSEYLPARGQGWCEQAALHPHPPPVLATVGAMPRLAQGGLGREVARLRVALDATVRLGDDRHWLVALVAV